MATTVRNLPTTDLAPQPPMLAPSAADALVPRSMTDAIKLAELMAGADVLPGHFKNKPGNCLAVIEQAMRWDMSPFAVAQKTFFVQGRMGYEAQLIAAVVHARAPLEGRLQISWSGEGKTRVCRVTGKFKGDPEPKVKSSPQVSAITVKNSPLWGVDPDQQLAYWTIRAWARLYAPEVILGVYDRDEVAEMHIGPENAVNITPPTPPATSRLDSLAAAIDDDPPHDPETGEVTTDVFGLTALDDETTETTGGETAHVPAADPPATGGAPGQPQAAIPQTPAQWKAWVADARIVIDTAASATGLEEAMRGWTTSGIWSELSHRGPKIKDALWDEYQKALDELRAASFGEGAR